MKRMQEKVIGQGWDWNIGEPEAVVEEWDA